MACPGYPSDGCKTTYTLEKPAVDDRRSEKSLGISSRFLVFNVAAPAVDKPCALRKDLAIVICWIGERKISI